MKYLILFLIFLPLSTASSIGVSPSNLEFSSPLEGETLTKWFTIYNPNQETIGFEIKEEKNIISFEPKEGTILPNKAIKVKSTLKSTPETETLVLINSYTLNDQNIQPAIALKTKISPILEKIESFEFEEIQTNENSIYLVILNNGNIKSQAELEIIIDTKTITQAISPLNPGESEEVDIKLNLDPGKYTAKITLKNKNKIFSEKQQSLEITSNLITGSFLGSKNKSYFGIAFAILLLALTAYIYQKRKNRCSSI